MTYEEIVLKLSNNGIYPNKVITNNKIVCLEWETPATFLIDDKIARLKEILANYPVKISKGPQNELIVIKLK